MPRIKKDDRFLQQRPGEGSEDVKDVIYIVCEGLTEKCYLECLNSVCNKNITIKPTATHTPANCQGFYDELNKIFLQITNDGFGEKSKFSIFMDIDGRSKFNTYEKYCKFISQTLPNSQKILFLISNPCFELWKIAESHSKVLSKYKTDIENAGSNSASRRKLKKLVENAPKPTPKSLIDAIAALYSLNYLRDISELYNNVGTNFNSLIKLLIK
ncbi:MAG: RloB family protein [Mycoplasmataceae bacterium]|jgi:hypothetical protein|nr:RloB family protein [Mycoplasmataceae bacterium]